MTDHRWSVFRHGARFRLGHGHVLRRAARGRRRGGGLGRVSEQDRQADRPAHIGHRPPDGHRQRKLRPDDQAVVRLRPRRARSRRGDEPGRLHQHVDARLREDPGAAKFRLLAAGLPAPPDGGAAERHRPRHADVPVPARSERRDSNAAGAVGRERRRRFPVAVPLPPVVAAPRPRGQGGVRMVEAGPHRSGGGDARLPLSRGGDASSFDSARPAAAALAALRTTSLPGVWGGVCSGTGSWSNRSRNSPAAARCSGLTGAVANAPGWTS